MASIHKRVTPSGVTRRDVRYRDPNRVDRSKSFQRKSDAARFAASVEADINRGEWIDPTPGKRDVRRYWGRTVAGHHLPSQAEDPRGIPVGPQPSPSAQAGQHTRGAHRPSDGIVAALRADSRRSRCRDRGQHPRSP